jgi:hypothetical protein
VTQWILASNGHPFRDRDAARIKRDLLLTELGDAVLLEVLPHPTGGFAVSVRRPPSHPADLNPEADPQGRVDDPVSPRDVLVQSLGRSAVRSAIALAHSTTAHSRPNAAPTAPSDVYPEAFRLSPAVRAFLGLHVQALVGAILLFQPHLVFSVTRLGSPSNATVGAILLALIAVCGALLAMIAVSRFLWTYTANTYVVDRNGVEQVQWYFERARLRRRAPRVNFAHLRSADVDQSVLQMLLNVGSVKLAAGGTDSYEVVLRHVASPRALQREFQRRLQRSNGPAQRETPGHDL